MNTLIQPELSVVIIARNEAHHIARAIESVLPELEGWPQAQVILVDSASTDETVEIARKYPIDIVRLKPDWFLSAAAGRYIGMRQTTGDLILYMDGDMELAAGWLEKAIPFLLERPELAGVAGYRRDRYMHNGQVVSQHDVLCDAQGRAVEVQLFGGGALYRRSALEQVGGFNPFIISDEEPELCMRLRHAGYKLMCIPYLMCYNYTLPVKSWDYFVRRFRTNLWLGHGQVPRYHLGTDLFWVALRERGTYLIYLTGALAGALSALLTLLTRRKVFLVIWMLAALGFFVVQCIRKRSVGQAWISLIHQSFVAYGAVRGFLIAPRRPETYPTDVEMVQKRGVIK